MLRLHFIDTDEYEFSAEDRRVIASEASEADSLARALLPLVEKFNLLVEPSASVLDETGDNAYTMEPHLIRWRVDPARGVATVAQRQLRKAFLHEAYHAARFRRLRHEANGGTWLRVAIGEGLATAFARDVGGAHEPWATYDPNVIESWTAELTDQPFELAGLTRWKFQHEDGRKWIAFRVGTWLVDQICARRGQSPADLVWTPVEEIEANCRL